MLLSETQERSLALIEHDRTKAISNDKPLRVYASLDEGKPVIPVWLDVIYS
ncbi:hypothetical protein VB735_03910 [Halotia wernerae UHCC 0503]|nr:hypothetical protein [Halotia wernerae UHCC 0503]